MTEPQPTLSYDEWKALPLAEIVLPDPSLFRAGAGAKPLAYVEVNGEPVAQLPLTGARHEVGVGAISHLHLTMIAGDATLRSRPHRSPPGEQSP